VLRYGRRIAAESAYFPRGGIDRVSTDAKEVPAADISNWRLDTDNGSMAPRSALDVLVDLNERVTTGHLADVAPTVAGASMIAETFLAAIILTGGAVFFWAIFTKRWRDAFGLLQPAAIAAF
jgi:hypothetical protein